MKKLIALVLVICAIVPALALADITIGQVDYAAHGTKCFAVITVAMDGDKIAAAYIDEFQFMPSDSATGVPNSDADFRSVYPEGQVLASKKANAEYYSGLMKDHAGSTVTLQDNYAAIENYVKGKTVAELEADVAAHDATTMIDAVSGCTLADTINYIGGIIEAAKAAK